MVNMTLAQRSCELILENQEALLLDKITSIIQHQGLAILLFLILLPIMVFVIASLIINPGKGKIKFGTVVWIYLLSTVFSSILGILGYLVFISV